MTRQKTVLHFLGAAVLFATAAVWHTDSTGADEINNRLSRERAASVVVFLQGQGIAGARMTSDGYGSKFPVASNETSEGRAKNRRVEVVLAQGVIAGPSR
jgi:outer membrane protein OmpA-like peptidoglycan-associated protein